MSNKKIDYDYCGQMAVLNHVVADEPIRFAHQIQKIGKLLYYIEDKDFHNAAYDSRLALFEMSGD